MDEGNDALDRWLAFANFMMNRTESSELNQVIDRTAASYLT